MPKSSTLTSGEPSLRVVTNRLDGLRSRCTIPARVRFGDGVARLQHVVDGVLDVELRLAGEHLAQILAAQKLHDHVRQTRIEGAHVEDAHDVLALNGRGGAGLTDETRRRLVVVDHARHHQLDGHLLAEVDVPHQQHHPHTAQPQHRFDAVFARPERRQVSARSPVDRHSSPEPASHVTR